MAELPIKHEDAVAFFRFQIISEMLDAQPGFVEATAKKLSREQFNDVVNKQLVNFSERTILSVFFFCYILKFIWIMKNLSIEE